MARYLVQVPQDSLSEDRKAGVEKSIVAAHHDVAGKDPSSVQVAITEIDAGCFFAGGGLIECDHIFRSWIHAERSVPRRPQGSTDLDAVHRRHESRRL